MNWHILWTHADEGLEIEPSWYARMQARHSYKCRHIDYTWIPRRVPVRTPEIDCDLGFLTQLPDLTLVSCRLLNVLRPWFEPRIKVIDVIDARGATAYAACASPNMVECRGNADSSCWRCRTCKQVIYMPGGTQKTMHILRADVPREAIYLGSDGILIPPSLIERIKQKRWNGAAFGRVAVEPHAKDGLPDDLSQLTQRQQRLPLWRRRQR